MQRNTKLLIAGAGLIALIGAGYAAFEIADHHGMRMQGFMGRHMGWHMGGPGMMQGPGEFTQRFDADKDGKVSQAEIDANRSQALAEADANKDGNLSLDEFQSLWLKEHSQRVVRSFQRLDSNGDANISAQEYADPMKDAVADFDQNKDGFITREDFDKFGKRMHGHMRDGHRHYMWMGDSTDDEGQGKAP